MLVPVTQMHQVTKYSAAEGQRPRFPRWAARIGRARSPASPNRWRRSPTARSRCTPSARSRAALLSAPDTPWQAEMEEAFPYEPTPDQAKAIDATKGDMEARPADGSAGVRRRRLRQDRSRDARGIQGGRRQETSRGARARPRCWRISTTAPSAHASRAFPVRIEELSRFTPKPDQKRIAADLAEGRVDVVIGTHRLLQKDVAFADLGLDRHRRRATLRRACTRNASRSMRASVDVLTLSATPIPAHAAHVVDGRAGSVARSKPRRKTACRSRRWSCRPATRSCSGRSPPNSTAAGKSTTCTTESSRIYARAQRARAAGAAARASGSATGRCTSRTRARHAEFIDGEIDVLVATTIIENGIDIPTSTR